MFFASYREYANSCQKLSEQQNTFAAASYRLLIVLWLLFALK